MKTIQIKQVDAFTTIPFGGNPAGVVTDAMGLTTDEMQRIAKEMNLSETAFVFPSNDQNADYFIRFFTPKSELPLAGHPTIATVHALIEEGKIVLDSSHKVIWQETQAGTLPIEIDSESDGSYTITMTQSMPKFETLTFSPEHLAKMLGIDEAYIDIRYPVQKVSTGIYWLVVPVVNLAAMQKMRPNLDAVANLSRSEILTGITAFSMETEDPKCDMHARTFAPNEGVAEDPVCGTGNGCLGAYAVENDIIHCEGKITLTNEQGIELNRPGKVYVTVEGKAKKITKIQVGGKAITVLEGIMRFQKEVLILADAYDAQRKIPFEPY